MHFFTESPAQVSPVLTMRVPPEILWAWMELHDSVSLYAAEKKIRRAAGLKRWQLQRWPRLPPGHQHSPLDERKLHHAAWNGCLDQVKALLELPIPAGCQDPQGWTAVHHAAFGGHLPVVKFLLRRGTEINSRDFFNCTPLHRACWNGHAHTAEYLLRLGASHEMRTCSGQTPLHLAAANGHLDTARVLLRFHAQADSRDIHKWTPLHWAVFSGWGGDGEAAAGGVGVTVDGDEGRDMSPLQLAVLAGNENSVRLLLRCGASANFSSQSGRTALHICAASGNKKILQLLLTGGAAVGAVDTDSVAPLHLAAGAGSRAVVHLLILSGAGLNAQDRLQMTPPPLLCPAGATRRPPSFCCTTGPRGKALAHTIYARWPRPPHRTDLRILGCELIQSAGILLRLPQVAMATGQVLFHRFFYSKSFVKHSFEIVAMACVNLASKIEEAPRRIRDVINVFHHLRQIRGKSDQLHLPNPG
ncbi:hypothetical protein SKAU_G00080320 [Synaphobranchus kaupii]|uniref:Cyclin-like domain-containing protein n=1 Tax=Synaphobranchus kaupii TaxID=118154 RepID=A0A9Q1FUD3_SYNKA|nr:hypothetical protein SKAU_G00080320 [Synaphobranchus kaupii]